MSVCVCELDIRLLQCVCVSECVYLIVCVCDMRLMQCMSV